MSIDYTVLPLAKGSKGATFRKGRERRKAIRASEEANKRIVRARDQRCRWPRCENCASFRPRLEVAHLDAKGFGGDHGTRSEPSQMMLLDFLTHQDGPKSLEQHGRRIVPLTERGTDGPCEFWQVDLTTGQWFLVARERAPFVYERD
jgi:hypothetical protein